MRAFLFSSSLLFFACAAGSENPPSKPPVPAPSSPGANRFEPYESEAPSSQLGSEGAVPAPTPTEPRLPESPPTGPSRAPEPRQASASPPPSSSPAKRPRARPLAPSPRHPEPGRLAGITEEHNKVRRALNKNIPPLKWNAVLARSAQSHANQIAKSCSMQHSGKPLGENLFGGSVASPKLALDIWAGEAKDYDYASGRCSGVCGHYTQVVWRDSTELGCGAATCENGMELWVCNYNPPGNYRGEKPY